MRVGKKERAALRLDKANSAIARQKASRHDGTVPVSGPVKLACHKEVVSNPNPHRAATAWPNRWGFTRGVKRHSSVRKVFA